MRAAGAREELDPAVDVLVVLGLDAVAGRAVQYPGVGHVAAVGALGIHPMLGRITESPEPGLEIHQVPPGGGVHVAMEGAVHGGQRLVGGDDRDRVLARLAQSPSRLIGRAR